MALNVVGDVAGNYLTLLALLEQMPKDAELICLGDPNDRGPRTKEVLEYLIQNGRTVQSNHAHMMTTEYRQRTNPHQRPRYYEAKIWPEMNGGMTTLRSYITDQSASLSMWWLDIPKQHIEWLESCPMFIETDKYILTHAPCRQKGSLADMADIGTGFYKRFGVDHNSENSLLWNRAVPKRPNPALMGKINLFGHNAYNAPIVFTPQYPNGKMVWYPEDWEELQQQDIYAIGLDTSRASVLTGFNPQEKKFYAQPYID